MPALPLHAQQAAVDQLREVRAGGRRLDAALERQVAGGQRAAVAERQQHGGAGAVGHQGGHGGDGGVGEHGSMTDEL